MNPEMPLQLAQAAPSDGGGGLGLFLPMIALFLIMYAIVIHPQRKQQKEHTKMLEEIERGDQIVTSGGIHGRITGISDDVLTVEIAERVKIKVNKSAVSARNVTKSAGESKS